MIPWKLKNPQSKTQVFFFRLTLYKDHIPFAEIVMLEKGEEFEQGCFFSPNGVGSEKYRWHSTSHFRVVNPMEEKHQLFICKDSGELIAFVPSLNHTKNKFPENKNEQLIKSLLESVQKKPNLGKPS